MPPRATWPQASQGFELPHGLRGLVRGVEDVAEATRRREPRCAQLVDEAARPVRVLAVARVDVRNVVAEALLPRWRGGDGGGGGGGGGGGDDDGGAMIVVVVAGRVAVRSRSRCTRGNTTCSRAVAADGRAAGVAARTRTSQQILSYDLAESAARCAYEEASTSSPISFAISAAARSAVT